MLESSPLLILFYTFSLCSSKSKCSLILLPEIQQCFGSDAIAGGIKFQFVTRIKADVNLIKNARANGIDCKDIKLSGANEGSNGGNGRRLCFEIS